MARVTDRWPTIPDPDSDPGLGCCLITVLSVLLWLTLFAVLLRACCHG
jgi:hypothetical protein